MQSWFLNLKVLSPLGKQHELEFIPQWQNSTPKNSVLGQCCIPCDIFFNWRESSLAPQTAGWLSSHSSVPQPKPVWSHPKPASSLCLIQGANRPAGKGWLLCCCSSLWATLRTLGQECPRRRGRRGRCLGSWKSFTTWDSPKSVKMVHVQRRWGVRRIFTHTSICGWKASGHRLDSWHTESTWSKLVWQGS